MIQEQQLHVPFDEYKEGGRKSSDTPTESSTSDNAMSQCPSEEIKTHNKLFNLVLTVSATEATPEPLQPETPTKATLSESSPISPRKKVNTSNFTLLELIGMGAYSKVALVEQIATKKKLAMKVMEKKFLVRVCST